MGGDAVEYEYEPLDDELGAHRGGETLLRSALHMTSDTDLTTLGESRATENRGIGQMEENVSISPPAGKLSWLRGERGQTLVEYALIIAVVSLGALAALGFLSGRIQNIFSKAGNSVEAVNVGAPVGGGPGGSGGTPPGNGTSVTGTGVPTGGGGSQWFGGGTMTSGPSGLTGLAGVYTNSTPSQTTCQFTLNGFTYSGVWVRETGDDWDGSGVSGDYDWACIANPPFTPPTDHTDMDGVNFAGNDNDGAEWYSGGTGVGNNNPSPSPSPAGAWDNDQGGSGTWFYYPQGGGGSGVWICTWHETSPGSSSYNFPGNDNSDYDDYCN